MRSRPTDDFASVLIEQMFELSRHGLLWLDPKLRVSGHNSVAAAILKQNDGVSLRDPKMVFERSSIGRELDAFVTRAHRSNVDWPSGGDASFVRRIDRPSGKVAYLLVAIRCLSPSDLVGVLVLLEDLGQVPALSTDVCQAVYGLTPAESRVARRLIVGRSAPAIAKDLGLSPLTIRTHIKRVFKKVGVRSQPQLMAALCRVAFLPVGHSSYGKLKSPAACARSKITVAAAA